MPYVRIDQPGAPQVGDVVTVVDDERTTHVLERYDRFSRRPWTVDGRDYAVVWRPTAEELAAYQLGKEEP